MKINMGPPLSCMTYFKMYKICMKIIYEMIKRRMSWQIWSKESYHKNKMLLLLSCFSHVRLCATPETAAHQASPSLGFFRQEHWSGLPFPPAMHENEKWKWRRSVVSHSLQPHGLQPTRLLHPWDFPVKSTGVGCHCLLQKQSALNN